MIPLMIDGGQIAMQVKSETYNAEWFRDYDNVTKLARHLVGICELIDPSEVVAYFEKPWKWSGEWDEMMESDGHVAVDGRDGMVGTIRCEELQ